MGDTSADLSAVRDGRRPGDVGAVVALHGVLYAREYGLDDTMEAYVATTLAQFVEDRARAGDAAGRLWVAEHDSEVAGSVGLTREEGPDGDEGRLRWFLLSPSARGRGLGRKLLDTALNEAHRRGYPRVHLWTIAGLAASRTLYDRAGFVLTEEFAVERFGTKVTEQRFDLELRP